MDPCPRKITLTVKYLPTFSMRYGKGPKISYIKVSDKKACANSADPDQTAPEGAV